MTKKPEQFEVGHILAANAKDHAVLYKVLEAHDTHAVIYPLIKDRTQHRDIVWYDELEDWKLPLATKDQKNRL